MRPVENSERPLGVYLVALYFIIAGALETIQKYREWDQALTLNPFGEHSIWELAAHMGVYVALALLVWNLAALGRLAALVYGYLHFGAYVVIASIYLLYEGETPLTITPLFVSVAIYHVTTAIPVIAYLQPTKQKQLFQLRLTDLLFPGE